jgi:N utilization substance protein A
LRNDLTEAINALEKERGIDQNILYTAIEEALSKAYRNHYGTEGQVRARVDRDTGEFKVFSQKVVVTDDTGIADELSAITLSEANKYGQFGIGDIVEFDSTPKSFGRIAAQTAKQVLLQRLKEAERERMMSDFSGKLYEIMTGVVQRIENGNVYVELGRHEGLLPASEQVENERYRQGERMKVYVLKVDKEARGKDTPIIVSRKNKDLIKRLFELEIPEVMDGVVQIKAISREPGVRSKVAVHSTDAQVDPVGSCVGPKGSRIERIVEELRGEKIDVIAWSADPIEFIANSLSAAKVIMVQINEQERAAKVVVPDHQLSLAIGMRGINAKLAARLTGWKTDIKSQSQAQEMYDELLSRAEEESDELDEFADDIESFIDDTSELE